MTKTIELTTSGTEPLTQTLALASEPLTVATLRAEAAALLAGNAKTFSLRYTDSDGDEVTIAHDADVKELADYMDDEQLERVTVTVVSQEAAGRRAASAVQTQLRGLVTAMSKLATTKPKQPTPANAMNLLVASLQTMDVAEDSEELAAIKKQLLEILDDDEFKKAVEELCASEELKDLADVMVAAIYAEDAVAIEETATARLDELLVFAQRLVARCPTLKPAMVNVAKNCMSGLVRLNDEGLADDGTSSSSSSSAEDVELEAREVAVHFGIICDGCDKEPLVGVRYKSLETPDFDVCEDCEASGQWAEHEPFIKIADPSRAPKHQRTPERVAHPFVRCDGCETSPIVGPRFKSKTAYDFDLCQACEASGKWKESHGPFTKIVEPGMMHAMKFTYRRGGKKYGHGNFGRHHGKFGRHHGKFDGHPGKFNRHGHHGPPGIPFDGPPSHHHGPSFTGFGPRPRHGGPGLPGHGPPPPPHDEGPRFGFGEAQRGPGFPTPGPPGFGLGHFGPPGPGFPGPHGSTPYMPNVHMHFGPRGCPRGRHGRDMRFSGDNEQQEAGRRRHGRGRWGREASDLEARFVEDVTIEDGTVVEAGKPLRKMWKLVNDGERAWPDGCYMITQPGNPMFPDRESSRIELPALAPGQEYIAGVDLVAPSQPGRYPNFWRVCDPADASFGHRFWIDIVVVGNSIAESTPSEAPTADSGEDEMKKSAEATPSTEASSDDDIEIIDVTEAQEADGDAEIGDDSEAFDENKNFKESMQILAAMGFSDLDKNLRALKLVDGNVGGAVNVLLSE
ncbi:uncharacterized protein PITG_00391 [Phytophthora infestans T30-4]|uniref:ZZ-type domain-containing protein n=1 Tax=Phytophthora infestans (strain T30-4) TaxID=403677 RepID=D0MQN9_PHYIT|nr:uncharacterized protein PITG_00391 [Phytophthora infestans T30-4]EEY57808.1 conserved hypothetical protein [Phytophthora infestans T30-4]|eukprot:XP_002908994.1 conserved hypothetical protein [Phytophthora infestans T30-4]